MRRWNHEPSGVPFRRRRPVRRRSIGGKLSLKDTGLLASVVPMRVRVEVHGGRSSTASIMRAWRVLQQIEGTGGVANVIEVARDGTALVAELDTAQAEDLARMPFVRRIVSLN